MDTAEYANRNVWKSSLAAGGSIAVGYMPAALAFGLLAKTGGLTILETVAMSAWVYAGASQYMALNLVAMGTGALEIILTTFIVNLRHLLMSASVSEKAEPSPSWLRAIYAFGITDEVFAVTATREGKVPVGFIGVTAVLAYLSWVLFSAVGHSAGAILPGIVQESMGIALYAMFIALLMPSLKKSMKVVWLAGTAAVLNSLLSLWLPQGWSIVAATLGAAVLVELVGSNGKEASQ
jgi:4-azaleucine resistance transporter AzlC